MGKQLLAAIALGVGPDFVVAGRGNVGVRLVYPR
jgi:hypothetical protein